MNTLDLEKVESLAADLAIADASIRKTLAMPANLENPADVIRALTGLARTASAAANSLAIIMAHQRERELLAARLTKGG